MIGQGQDGQGNQDWKDPDRDKRRVRDFEHQGQQPDEKGRELGPEKEKMPIPMLVEPHGEVTIDHLIVNGPIDESNLQTQTQPQCEEDHQPDQPGGPRECFRVLLSRIWRSQGTGTNQQEGKGRAPSRQKEPKFNLSREGRIGKKGMEDQEPKEQEKQSPVGLFRMVDGL